MEYTFRTIGRTCAATGQELVAGTDCRSALILRDGRQERQDYLAAAWPGPPAGTIGHWACRVPLSNTRRRTVDLEDLMQHFDRLNEELLGGGNTATRRLRYGLALTLMGKRRLELSDVRPTLSRDTGELLILVGSKGEGPYEVVDEQLTAEELSALRAEWETISLETERDQTEFPSEDTSAESNLPAEFDDDSTDILQFSGDVAPRTFPA